MKHAVLIGITARPLTLLIAVLIPLFAAGPATAQMGAICLFAEPTGTDCTITDQSPGVLTIYVVHTLTTGAMGSEFSAPRPSCMVGASWLADSQPFPVTLGNSQTGVSIGYGTCLSGPIHILTMTYLTSGTTQTDCLYRVRPHPADSFVQMVDCSDNLLEAGAGKVYINSDQGCVCSEFMPPAVAVNPSTLDFGTTSTPRTFRIINEGNHTLEWTVSDDRDWLSASPSSGSEDATITVTLDRTLLGPDLNEGHVLVESNGGSETVTVLALNGARLSLSPDVLDFGNVTQSQYFRIRNTGLCCLSWTAQTTTPWIILIMPESGTGNRDVLVAVNRGALPNGIYNGDITVISNGGTQVLPVSMAVMPTLSVSPPQLAFGEVDMYRPITIVNTGSGLLEWSATTSAPWLSINPAGGMGGPMESATAMVAVDRSGLANGDYEGAVVISSNGGGESVVLVTMSVQPELVVSPPELYFSPSVLSQTFSISNAKSGVLEWSAAPDSPWITVTPLSGVGNATVTVEVDPDTAAGGYAEGSIAVTSNGGASAVAVHVGSPPILSISPTSLQFTGLTLSTTFTIRNSGAGTLSWNVSCTAPWLQCTPASGTGYAVVRVDASRCDIPVGPPANTTVEVTSTGGNGTVTVAADPMPRLATSPTSLFFYGNPSSATLQLLTPCTPAINWAISVTPPYPDWLNILPESGTGPANVRVTTFVPTSPPEGEVWQCTLIITSPQPGGSTSVPVTWDRSPSVGTSTNTWGNLKSKYTEPPKK